MHNYVSPLVKIITDALERYPTPEVISLTANYTSFYDDVDKLNTVAARFDRMFCAMMAELYHHPKSLRLPCDYVQPSVIVCNVSSLFSSDKHLCANIVIIMPEYIGESKPMNRMASVLTIIEAAWLTATGSIDDSAIKRPVLHSVNYKDVRSIVSSINDSGNGMMLLVDRHLEDSPTNDTIYYRIS